MRSALIALNIGGKESYGFDKSSLMYAFKKTIKYDPSSHEVKRNLAFVGDEYNGDTWRIIPELAASVEARIKSEEFLKSNKITKFIAVAPGSIWETKKYPPAYFRSIIEYFVERNFQIVLIGGIQDAILCHSLQQELTENVFVTAGNFSLVESVELLRSASLLICNDSAPTHLGMCAEIPVLTIYCSTIPQFGFYPYNLKSDFISFDKLQCKPCGIHGFSKCPIDSFDCAKLLTPDMVIQKAQKLLSDVR
jgi:heptosyltransferase-2